MYETELTLNRQPYLIPKPIKSLELSLNRRYHLAMMVKTTYMNRRDHAAIMFKTQYMHMVQVHEQERPYSYHGQGMVHAQHKTYKGMEQAS
jgi:hypothetical protein